MKFGPCGRRDDARTTDVSRISTFTAGETIAVEFDETIYHPGYFRIAFDDDGVDAFPEPEWTPSRAPYALPILADGLFADHQSGGPRRVEVTLPNVPCTRCTLQLIQYMADTDTSYYQCADLILLEASSGAAGAGGKAGSTGAGGSTTGGAANGGSTTGGTANGGTANGTATGGAANGTATGGAATGGSNPSGDAGTATPAANAANHDGCTVSRPRRAAHSAIATTLLASALALTRRSAQHRAAQRPARPRGRQS